MNQIFILIVNVTKTKCYVLYFVDFLINKPIIIIIILIISIIISTNIYILYFCIRV